VIPSSVYAIILILLMPQLPTYQTNQASPVKIGFSCCHFYDLDSGTPVFMQGEEIWLKADRDLTAVLRPVRWFDREIASINMFAHSSARLYTFRAEDRPGLWQLKVQSGGEDLLILLYLVRTEAEASLTSIVFNLTGTQLIMSGTVAIETPHQGGILLLKRNDQIATLEMDPVPFREGSLRAQISWDPANPRSLSVAPYAPSLTSPNVSSVWAEVSLEIPLVKQVAATQVFTLLPQIVTKTNRATIKLESKPQQDLEIELPNLHQVGFNGQAPLRLGPIHLKVFVEIEKTIYVLATDAFLLRDGFASTASVIQIPPLLSPVTFKLTDDLQRLSDYSLVLIAKDTGLNVVWNKTVIPPVTRIRVVNMLTNDEIDDYDIASDQIREIVKMGSQTYAIPRDSKINAELKLSIGGVPLQPNEFNPQSTTLKPLSTVYIRTSASTVRLRVTDALGSAPSSAAIKLTRIVGENRTPTLERSWKAVNGIMKLMLPIGRYEIEIMIEGSTVRRQFSVRLANEFIDLKLNELVLAESRKGLILAGVGSLIILIEALVAIRLWKNLVARRKSRLEQQEDSY